MSPVKGIVGAVSELVDRLTLPAREKKQLETDLLKVFVEWEQRVMEARSEVLAEEVRGNWLQRSWRPLVMLTFALIVLVGTFTSLPSPEQFPAGCRFSDRCARRRELSPAEAARCAELRPPERECGTGHRCCCFAPLGETLREER